MSITILGREIPLYGLLFFTGIGIAALVAYLFLTKKRNIEGFDFTGSAIYAMVGAIIGAKLLALLVSIEYVIIIVQSDNFTFMEKMDALLKNGFVFYGGLIGGILGFKIYGWQFKIKMASYFDVAATVLPLGHAFGRVGCFFGGCCYGVEHHGWLSHVYQEGSVAAGAGTPIGVPLLPVQLIEAACLLLLFAGLMVLFFMNKKKTPWLQTLAYACSYAVVRFILEFFRGDKERGGFLGVSTSQWISILIVIGAVLLILYLTVWQKKKAACACENTSCDGESESESAEATEENACVCESECCCACVEEPAQAEATETVDVEQTPTEE